MNFERCFSGKKVLVTGGGRGIGRAIVSTLDSIGAKVYTVVKSEKSLESLKNGLPNVIPIQVDLSNWDDTKAALEPLECMDVVINNAGTGVAMPFHDLKPEDFDKVMSLNVKAVINVSQIFTKKMIEEKRAGSIVNVSSTAGIRAFANFGIYASSKAALQMLSKVMAIELGPHKITVNVVNPAMVETELLDNWIEGVMPAGGSFEETKKSIDDMMRSKTPTNFTFMPVQEVVTAVLFLASGLTTQITGSNLAIDGGMLIN